MTLSPDSRTWHVRGISLRQWRAFALVARYRSFARAASELHLTPSAVSLQIKELERACGLLLLVRNGRGVELTAGGQQLLKDVNRALNALDEAGETLTRLRGRETGVVSVGMVRNAKCFLPRLLARFREMHRDVEIRPLLSNREQLLRQLSLGEVDIAVMGAPPDPLVEWSAGFAPQPLCIVASPDDPLCQQRAIPPAALNNLDFVVREPGSGTRATMERAFKQAGISPHRTMEMTSNEMIKQAVIARMGLGFMSLHSVGLELRTGALIALDVVGFPILRHWHVVSAPSAILTKATEALRGYIVEHGRRLIDEQFADAALRIPGQSVVAASP